MNSLALFTGGTRRGLDRETLDHHELDMLVSVHLSDLNDNRSIVNDVELVVYDKLDTMFVNILLNSLFSHVLISNPTSEYY